MRKVCFRPRADVLHAACCAFVSITLQRNVFQGRPLSSYIVQLTSLDMEVVSEESKSFANTVFLKKSMYYNMRSRILKRHAGHVIRKVRHMAGLSRSAWTLFSLFGRASQRLKITEQLLCLEERISPPIQGHVRY